MMTRTNWHAPLTIRAFMLGFVLVWSNAPTMGQPPASAPDLDAFWSDLEKPEPLATRAVLAFAETPSETISFLREKLQPAALTVDRAMTLLKALGSEDKEEWNAAFEELEYFDPRLAMDLETLMDRITESPARQRMVAILSSRQPDSLAGKDIELHRISNGTAFNFRADRGSWWAEYDVSRLNQGGFRVEKKKWTRAVRAMALLQHLGAPEAVAILDKMTTGHPEAQPTIVAKEAMKTLQYGSFE